ncbi:hypothetical protein [Deinococcus pimensis]|uniref:hypothetical protein n=1 Tax=Deinococcus pimensis TaxID=309888 RepID=UPI000486F489|nr:hypothetical protein [Deinococcus pimensis]
MRPAARLALVFVLLGAGAAGAARLDVTVRDPGDRAHVATVRRAWSGAEQDLRALGLRLPGARLEAAASAADLAARTGEPWFVAASTRGTVIRTQRLGALAARGLLPLTVRHEAFHLAQPRGLPRWLAEGLARVFSGEASRDPASPTGLEGLRDADLDHLLATRDPARLTAAYREAARRARALVGRVGWKGALGGQSSSSGASKIR